MKKIMIKTFNILFLVVFIGILLVLFFYSKNDYILKRGEITTNSVLVLAIDCIFVFFFVTFFHKKEIVNKKYYKIIFFIQIILFIIQLIILFSIKFHTGWDVLKVENLIDTYLKMDRVGVSEYLTKYPNNILLTGILILFRLLPFIGKYYETTLIINTILVNLSILFIGLTVRNIKGNQNSLLTYFLTIPFLVLVPWYVIPYTDTFALFGISVLVFLYSKKELKIGDYYIIGFVLIFFSFIKPTVFIIGISMFITSILFQEHKPYQKLFFYKRLSFALGVCIAFSLCYTITQIIDFEKVPNRYSMTPIHYVLMGQNYGSAGFFSSNDEEDSYVYGMRDDFDKLKIRLKQNKPIFHKLFINKILISYNDGTFSWGHYGNFYPNEILSEEEYQNLLQNIYYINGKYYCLFLNIINILWRCLLLFVPFLFLKKVSKCEFLILLSILGISLFLLLFESFSRHLYCFSGLFIIISTFGINQIFDYFKE